MPEVAHTGKYHGDIVFVCRFDDFAVAHGTTRLDDGTYSRFSSSIHAVAEGEKGVAGEHAALRVEAFAFSFQYSDL